VQGADKRAGWFPFSSQTSVYSRGCGVSAGTPDDREGDPDVEIILEINRIGGALEVRAVSAGDGLEVTFPAPANAPKADLERVARSKLAYVRGRRSGSGGEDADGGGTPGGGRGGLLA
jgi:hypothetical protein